MSLETIAKDPKHGKLDVGRRWFLKVLIAGGSVTGAMTLAGHVLTKSERESTTPPDRNRVAKSGGISVSDYAKEIINAAYRIGDESIYDFQELSFQSYIIGGVASILGSFRLDWEKNRTFLALTSTGGLGALVERVVYLHSTQYAAKVMQDKRFVEYGLDAAFQQKELEHMLSSGTREWTDLKAARRDLISIARRALLYPLGHGEGVSSIFRYQHNMKMARLLQLSYQIGDRVKEMIRQGYTDAPIKYNLSILTATDLRR